MVSEALSTSPRRLYQLHPADSPAEILAQLVVMAAHHLDHVHAQLADAAQTAASTLTRVAAGKTQINSLGVLQNSATQIDILAARRADAVDRLKEVIHAYRQVAAPGDATSHPTHRPGTTPIRPSAADAQPVRAARGR
ncbi:hypothetical protein [Streptomyces sp. NBC_01092]|uniref:hypothetical protein n=1 Tax=Streptomyces sp. NBC_01092 TaxID=2903748 RepID=UPI003862DE55|nr:hypothetical protein OG254_38935 [Streptomyces sp. NBC_01092]